MANEKRLIVADAISNGIALYLAENAYLNDTAQSALEMVGGWLNEAPTVNAVEVVRCKDCKNKGQCSIQDAMNWSLKTEMMDYFCSYGERKDNDC